MYGASKRVGGEKSARAAEAFRDRNQELIPNAVALLISRTHAV
jgi:hypothetical protein